MIYLKQEMSKKNAYNLVKQQITDLNEIIKLENNVKHNDDSGEDSSNQQDKDQTIDKKIKKKWRK